MKKEQKISRQQQGKIQGGMGVNPKTGEKLYAATGVNPKTGEKMMDDPEDQIG